MPDYDKEAAAERTKGRTIELTDKLENGMKELYDSDKYKDYLKTMAKFPQYSSRNIMLIKQQMPTATRVASFKLWQGKFNRQVKKGAKSLYIYAPMGERKPKTKLTDILYPETGEPALDKNGDIIKEELAALSVVRPQFRLVPVFDISSTHGDPLPELVEDLTGNVAHYEAFLQALKEVSPLPIVVEPMSMAQDGYCRFGEKIGIREGMSEPQTVAAVIHEIVHSRLHDKNNLNAGDKPKPKAVREIESESIAYVVAGRWNIETAPNSFGYLATYGSRDMSEIKASLDVIRKEASTLITAIEFKFNAICQQRGIDLSAKPQEQSIPSTSIPDKQAEPQYTTETHTENIAGVDFEFSEVKPIIPEQNIVAAKSDDNLDNQEESYEIMPDPAIGFSERDLYGYTIEDMLPLTTNRALELFGTDHTIYMLYSENEEVMVFDSDEIITFGSEGIFGITKADWEMSPLYAEQLAVIIAENNETVKESDFIHAKADCYAVYQIKDGDGMRDYRYEGSNNLEQRGLTVDRENYTLAYVAPLKSSETLDTVFAKLNIDRPDDFNGHSLSTSDIIVINKNNEITSHFVDSIGFKELPAFLGVEVAKRTEQIIPTVEPTVSVIEPKSDDKTEQKAVDYNQTPPLDIPEPEPPKPVDIPLYRQTPDFARENNELDLYRQSLKLNRECASAIDAAIRDSNYKPQHYDLQTAAKNVIAEYGAERVEWVLANTMQKQRGDGRYSSSNQAWAKSFDIPEKASGFFCNAHPVLINSLIDKVREKPSLLATLEANEKKSKEQFSPKPESGKDTQTKTKNEAEVN